MTQVCQPTAKDKNDKRKRPCHPLGAPPCLTCLFRIFDGRLKGYFFHFMPVPLLVFGH